MCLQRHPWWMTLDPSGIVLLSRTRTRAKTPHAELNLPQQSHFILVIMDRLRKARLKKSVGELKVSSKKVDFFPILVWKAFWDYKSSKDIWWYKEAAEQMSVWLGLAVIHCLVSDEGSASRKCESVPGIFLWLWHLCHSDRILLPRKPGGLAEERRYETGLDVQVLSCDGSN